MRRILLSILALLLLTVTSAWADKVMCSPEDIGKILGSDGNVYAQATDMPQGVTVAGMIAYIDITRNWGLVMGPSDLYENGKEGSWKYTQGQAMASCGKYDRPLPAAALSGWCLPSSDDFWKMVGAFGCQMGENLRDFKGRQSVSCANNDAHIWRMQSDKAGYWTSTQSTAWWLDDAVKSWTSEKRYVRPCFFFNVVKSDELFDVAYFDPVSKSMQTALNVTPITNETTMLGDEYPDQLKWYCVSGDVICEKRILTSGKIAIILEDGCFFQAKAGIRASDGTTLYGSLGSTTLSIYAQSVDNSRGKLVANYKTPASGFGNDAAIGGDGFQSSFGDHIDAGTINIYGGDITASSIGGGRNVGYSQGGMGGNIFIGGGLITVSDYVGNGKDDSNGSDIRLSWSHFSDRYDIKRFNNANTSNITLEKPFTDGTEQYAVSNNFDGSQIAGKVISSGATFYNVNIGGGRRSCLSDG